MRRLVFAISIIAIGLLMALPLAGSVQALGHAGNHNPLAAFKNNDKDKDDDQGNGNGNGNGQSDDDHGNGNSNGQSDDDHGNGQSDEDHGNAGANGNGNVGGNGDASDDQGDDSGNGDTSDDSANSDSGSSHGSDDHGKSADDQGDDDSHNGSENTHGASSGQDEDVDESGTPVAGSEGKVRVCHLTGREDFPYNLIEVSEHALPAHESHGDFVAPDDAASSNDCNSDEGNGTPVAAGESSPESEIASASPESGTPAASPESEAKVLVCHVTGSNDNPVILIEVNHHALPAHLKHGDIEAPAGARSSNACEAAMEGTPVASPQASS